MKSILFISFILFFTSSLAQLPTDSRGEYLADNMIPTAALLEEKITTQTQAKKDTTFFIPVASSVLLASDQNHFILTAGHVIKDAKDLHLRLTQKDDSVYVRHSLDSLENAHKKEWNIHQSLDISALWIDGRILYGCIEHALDIDSLYDDPQNYRLGTGIYIVGFPSSIARINYRVIRKGIISAFIDSTKFLADCQIYPGNSGGPVFSSAFPRLIAQAKSRNLDLEVSFKRRSTRFLGIVTDYYAYTDRAVSQQTNRLRITFEENSGLSVVISSTAIQSFIKELLKN